MHFLASWKRALGIDLISYRSYSFVSLFRGFAFLTRVYVEYSLQNRFVFFISLFGLSAILKIRNGEHAHYVGLVVAYTWNREKQMFVALGKEFDVEQWSHDVDQCQCLSNCAPTPPLTQQQSIANKLGFNVGSGEG